MSLVTESEDKNILRFLDQFCTNIVANLIDQTSTMSKKLSKRKNNKKNYYSVSMPEFYTSFTLQDRQYVMGKLSPDLRDLGYRCAFIKSFVGYRFRIYWL